MRPTASIIVPVRGSWETTRACLEALRPTLRLRDQVVAVVDETSTPGLSDQLRRFAWVTIAEHHDRQTSSSPGDAGAEVATGDVLVFLHCDTLVTSRWLDPLLAPFADPTVAATGPRTNHVLGPQLVERVSYDVERLAHLNTFGRAWHHEHRGQVTEVAQLAEFCMAVRRDLFGRLGGSQVGTTHGANHHDRLCSRMATEGFRLLISHGSFVHHHGQHVVTGSESDAPAGARSALISASLIVKDEEDVLEQCLESVRELADEVVVYDTGSTDRTVEIARQAGAVVVEGYWDDDFGRARNASMSACTGTWILVLDADEVLQGDLPALRRQAVETAADALTLPIDNLDDAGGVTFSHSGPRLFRRDRGHWHGRLHEQVQSRTSDPLLHEVSTYARVLHAGYTTTMMQERGKQERNERVARAATVATGGRDPLVLVNLGRALNAAGKDEEALDTFRQVRELTTNDALLRQALRAGAEILMSSGCPAEALEWVDELRRHTTASGIADYLEGLARLNLMDMTGALACFERIDEAQDEDYAVSAHVVHLRRGLALAAAERWEDAAASLLAGVTGRRVTDAVWAPLVEAHWRSGRAMDPVLDIVADDQLLVLLGQVLNATPAAADALADELWARLPGDRRLLAFALHLAPRLSLPRALEWAARLRGAGLDQDCPLLAIAGSSAAPGIDRIRAAAIVHEGFGDDRGAAALPEAAASLAPREFLPALVVVDELAPSLLPSLIMCAASTSERTRSMAEALRSVGADEQAQLLQELAAI